MAPPYDFLEKAFLPLLNRMGPTVRAELLRPGFYPAGGGEVRVKVDPCSELSAFELVERGAVERREGRILLARLPRHIAVRERMVLQSRLDWPEEAFRVEHLKSSHGPGNAVVLEMESQGITEVVTAFGQRGVATKLRLKPCDIWLPKCQWESIWRISY
jgi:RNA 3'-terminal phosphate cyclase (ATP)